MYSKGLCFAVHVPVPTENTVGDLFEKNISLRPQKHEAIAVIQEFLTDLRLRMNLCTLWLITSKAAMKLYKETQKQELNIM